MSDERNLPATTPRSPAASAMTTRSEFGSTEISQRTETATTAAAAGAAALVQARYVMALQRPRDLDDVRAKLLRECQRPGFAKSAWYKNPIGQGIEGLSIRFVEAALRILGNHMSDAVTIYEDELRRIDRVTVTDLETNVTHQKDVIIEKTVERNNVRDGQQVISSRKNSSGKTTFLVVASEDELLGKEGSITSKALRTLGLRLLPGDIKEECTDKIKATNRNDAAKDPDAERKAIADAFAGLGVMPSDLKELLGKDIAQASPSDIVDLRGLFTAIREGEASFPEALLQAKASRGELPEQAAQKPLTERIKEQGGKAKLAEPPPPAEASADRAPELTDEERDYQSSLKREQAAPPKKSFADAARERVAAKKSREPGEEG